MPDNRRMNMEQNRDTMLSIILVTLLKGVLYRDSNPSLWQELPSLHGSIIEQGALLGLDFLMDDNEGYACFRQKNSAEGEPEIPRLVQRRQLSFTVSLLCVLLRKKVIEADAGGESTRVIINREKIIAMMGVYMPDSTNEAKLWEQIDTAIKKVVEMGFLRVLETERDTFEVRRIIKAFVDAEWITGLDDKLKEYREYSGEQGK